MSSRLPECLAILQRRPELSELGSDGQAVVGVLQAAQSAQQLLCLEREGWITLVIGLMGPEHLSEELVAGLFQWSEAIELARFSLVEGNLWLRLDCPSGTDFDPALFDYLVTRAISVVDGFISGDSERMTTAPPMAGALPPSRAFVEASLAISGYTSGWNEQLSAWVIRDPDGSLGGRPIIAPWRGDRQVLPLLLGIRPMEPQEVAPNLASALLEVNDVMTSARFGVIEGLGLVVRCDVPLGGTPGLRLWLDRFVADVIAGNDALSPPEDDLGAKLRLTRAWITQAMESDGVAPLAVLDGVLAAFRGEEPPALGSNDLWPAVLGQTAELLQEIAQSHPQALVMLAMSRDLVAAGQQGLDELWDLLESYADDGGEE